MRVLLQRQRFMTLGAYVALTSRRSFWCIQLLNQLNAGLVCSTTQMPSPQPSSHEAVHQRACWQVTRLAESALSSSHKSKWGGSRTVLVGVGAMHQADVSHPSSSEPSGVPLNTHRRAT
jgi:hypothetical protein